MIEPGQGGRVQRLEKLVEKLEKRVKHLEDNPQIIIREYGGYDD